MVLPRIVIIHNNLLGDITFFHTKVRINENMICNVICCGERGRALASPTGVRRFETQRCGRLPSLICRQELGSIYMPRSFKAGRNPIIGLL